MTRSIVLLAVGLLALVATANVVACDADAQGQARALAADDGPLLVYSWVNVTYDWSAEEEQAAIRDGRFIPANNAITGVKVYKDVVYLTVPRWRPGVPSTLNKVVSRNGQYVLQPYPSWDWQYEGNYTALQYVQSMEIDSTGVMWILDTGRRNIFAADQSLVVNGPPKLVLWNMNTETVIKTFVFPDDVAPYDSSFLNDLVVDERNGFAYISDAMGTGAIVIFNNNTNTAWRWVDPSMGVDHPKFTINGVNYTLATPEDGIALSADGKTLYYCALASLHLYSVPTAALRDPAATAASVHAHVTLLGMKPSGSDGLAFSNNGMLYFGAFSEDAIYQWDPSTPLSQASILVQDRSGMQWADTFAFDGTDRLVFTTNKLQKWFFGEMDFSGKDGPNFRVWSVYIGGNSYLSGLEPGTTPGSNGVPAGRFSDTAGIILCALLAVFAVSTTVLAIMLAKQCRANRMGNGAYVAMSPST